MPPTPPAPAPPPAPKPPTAKRPARPRPARKKTGGRQKKKAPPRDLQREALLLGLEVLGLSFTGVAAVIVLLGYAANRFSGTRFFTSLLPFAGGILGLIVLMAILLIGWRRLRTWLKKHSALLPPAIALGLALLTGCFAMQDRFTQAFGYYRTLVGGKEEAGRVTLAHQVYASYRRLDIREVQKMIDRAAAFQAAIEEAAATYAVDADLLQGLAATESSFLPRDSSDGGRGLFQITQVPATVTKEVDDRFPPENRQPERSPL